MFRKLFEAPSPFELSPARKLITYTLLIFWAVIVLFPFYWMFTTAFKLPIDVSTGPKYIPFVDYEPVLNAWNEMKDFILRPYINTVTIGLVSSVITLFVGSFAAYALVRFEYRPKPALVGVFILCGTFSAILILSAGIPWPLAVVIGVVIYLVIAFSVGERFKGSLTNNDIAFWLISQRMLPPIAVILPLFIMFSEFGLLDKQFALIIVYTAANLPLAIWFMRDFFLSIPLELEESAFIDGASRFQVLQKVILPLSVPGLVATFLIILIFAWNEFIFAQFLTFANSQTMPVLVSAQNATRGPQWWNISLLVLFMVAPIVLMAIALERFIARGLLMGAVKG